MQNATPQRTSRDRRIFACFLVPVLMVASGCASADWRDQLKEVIGDDSNESENQPLSTDEVGGGLKEALRVGTETVVTNLGAPDGFNLDPQIHIPLPGKLSRVKKTLKKVGMDSMLGDLEVRLNRAAEIATPKAKTLFLGAISDMTLDDVMSIYNGPDDAATEYFKNKMSGPLAVKMRPVIDASLADAGAVRTYDNVMQRYNAIPLVPEVNADLSGYVVQKGMDGIFYYLAKEEAAIRKDPAKRTTEILKRIFSR